LGNQNQGKNNIGQMVSFYQNKMEQIQKSQ